jgi:hypothetical protein
LKPFHIHTPYFKMHFTVFLQSTSRCLRVSSSQISG